jgi:hypothetical protein
VAVVVAVVVTVMMAVMTGGLLPAGGRRLGDAEREDDR